MLEFFFSKRFKRDRKKLIIEGNKLLLERTGSHAELF